MHNTRFQPSWSKLTLVLYLALTSGCGGSDSCDLLVVPDPSGIWRGTLAQASSDCPGNVSAGGAINVEHDVSIACAGNDDSEVSLVDDQGRTYSQLSFSTFGRGSFVVEHQKSGGTGATITVTYNNFDGSLADAEVKIRNYESGQITCSERYMGQIHR